MDKTYALILNYNNYEKTMRIAKDIINYDIFTKTIIVDNCSKNDSLERLSELKSDNVIILETGKNGGFSFGHNYGIKYINENFDAKYIFVLGSDIIIERQSLLNCYDALEKDDNIGVISPIMLDYKKEVDKDFSWKFQTYRQCLSYIFYLSRRRMRYKKYVNVDQNNDLTDTDCIRGSCMLFRNKALIDVDMFDENTFLFYEENIICKKIKDKGYSVKIRNNNFYIHDHVIVDEANYIKFKSSLNSAYYYLSKYVGINAFQKLIYKCFAFFGRIEYKLFSKLKKRKR